MMIRAAWNDKAGRTGGRPRLGLRPTTISFYSPQGEGAAQTTSCRLAEQVRAERTPASGGTTYRRVGTGWNEGRPTRSSRGRSRRSISRSPTTR